MRNLIHKNKSKLLSHSHKSRGFTLMELMVVIILVSLLAVMAIPVMSRARLDRRAYDDAGSISQLFRDARTRAMARGSAILIAVTSNGGTNRGTFRMWEAVQQNAGSTGAYRTPVSTCKSPANWLLPWPPPDLSSKTAPAHFLDGVDLNGTIQQQADIRTQVLTYQSTDTTTFNEVYFCFTPMGRTYVSTANPPVFDSQLPFTEPIEIRVSRYEDNQSVGIQRRVLIPPSGMARVTSK